MRISIYILYERLKKWNPIMTGIKTSEKKLLINSQLMSLEIEPIPQHLLIGNSDYFNAALHLSDQCIISIGMPSDAIQDRNSCICISDKAELFKVYRDVQEIFMNFNLWDEELNNAVINNASLEDIFTLSIPIFENPIFIHDTNAKVMANVNEMSGQFSWDYDSTSKEISLPLDIMNDFKISDEYQQTMNTKGAQMFSAQQFGYRILYINLWFEESYLGRICINELGREIIEGDYELIEHLAYVVLTTLRQVDTLLSDVSNDLKQSLLEVLEFKETNEVVLLNRLQAFNWEINDSYSCVSIYLQKRDYSTYAVDLTCHHLENMFPYCCIFLYKDRILIITNPYKSELKEDDFFIKLTAFLREGLFKASVSSTGQDFHLLWYYFLQTDIAFKIGSRKNPMSWLYKFNVYKLQYILEQATNELMPLMLCESHLLKLHIYEKKHNSDFFKTLRVYLEKERNLAQTARALFVHRSTLLYRLKKIKSIIKVDLDDPKIRMHIMISYELLDNIPSDN